MRGVIAFSTASGSRQNVSGSTSTNTGIESNSKIALADALNETGVIKYLSDKLFRVMQGWPWPWVLLGLVVAYLYVHYSFASMTAHATALYPGFLTAALAGGVALAVATGDWTFPK